MRALFLSFVTAATFAADGNRLTYLDDDSPFWPTAKSPKFVTPQWVGEPGVDAVVILAIDDMRDPAKYEAFLRPILERLKKIDGRAPVSIMTNTVKPDDPQLAAWLKEGLSLEIHTLAHPCPCLGKATFEEAKRTYHGCVDLLSSVPGNKPVAFRMPCCDSMNSASPRFFAEIFNKASEQGRWLAADSSVFMRPPGDRYEKYFVKELRPPSKVTLADYAGFIEDYPYPYVIGNVCWEFPCMTPSDWQAFNAIGAKQPAMLDDWKAGLDYVVEKQGVFTAVFHPHGWSDPSQWVSFIDYAQEKFGKRVKFLNFREAVERLEEHALAKQSLRDKKGADGGVRLLDLNSDGFMDVVMGGESKRLTRTWQPKEAVWRETETPFVISDGAMKVRFGVIEDEKSVSASVGMTFRDGKWTKSPIGGPYAFSDGVKLPPVLGKMGVEGDFLLRDFDNDGRCELLIGNDKENVILAWDKAAQKWKNASFSLPDGVTVIRRTHDDGSRWADDGLRFVDLNGDGFDDIIQSNERGYAIHLWAGNVRNDLGWTKGWSHLVGRGPISESSPPPIVINGQNNGVWFHRNRMVMQNETTKGGGDNSTWIKSFKDLIAVPVPPEKTPEESLKCFIPRPGFTVETVAAEPLVASPIAFEWDAMGRLWVVEMRDYPLGMDGKGSPGGVVKLLTDTDADGRYDKATAFAEGLPFPTGIFPWRDGVIVAATPDILFLRDKDGDGKAEERTVLFTGFRPGNQQHRMNGFEWGLEGWLYGGNGDSGGNVKLVGTVAHGAQLPTPNLQPTSISGRDFRFQPDTGAFEAESGQTQYGRRRDDWGNWFGNNNPTWLWHYTLEDRYLRRNPKLAVKSTRKVLANYDGGTRVFPAYALGDAPTRMNQPQTLGNATSANSPTPYRDELFGSEFATSVFISEPVYNAIHRELLAKDGISFLSHRAEDEKQSEFLTSTDLWFRPTMLKTGPDGALYIADMHRFVLEHPEWIAPETQSRLDLRAGADKGRVWRVAPTGAKLRPIPNLAKLDNAALALAVDSPNGWQRDTAQRLLIERGAKDAADTLRRMLRLSKNPKARLQALATLDTLSLAESDDIRAGLRDRVSAVKQWALRVSETHTKIPTLLDDLLPLAEDPDLPVRAQLAFSLGAWRDPRAHTALEKLALLVRDQSDMRIPIQSSLSPDDPLFAKLNTPGAIAAPPPSLPKATTPDRAKVVASYGGVAQLKGDAARGHELFKQQCAICHRLKGEGKEVGPDLGMTADKPLDWMLVAMFDPGAAVEPRYQSVHVQVKGGAEYVGVMASETGNNITLRLAGGNEQAVLREDIKLRESTGKSLMPDGLESVLKPQDVADVLAWVRGK